MNEALARQLVDDYIHGWETADISRILSSIGEDCLIIESHGPTYYGPEQVERWVEEWSENGTVDLWTIDSFFFSKAATFFEWSFTCTIDSKTDSINGASVVQFRANKISHLHEYRMTQSAFDYFTP